MHFLSRSPRLTTSFPLPSKNPQLRTRMDQSPLKATATTRIIMGMLTDTRTMGSLRLRAVLEGLFLYALFFILRTQKNLLLVCNRVQKIGSKVHNRIRKGAETRLNSVYVKSQETVQGLEKTVAVVSGAQIHIHTQSEQLKTTLQQMQLYMETKSIGLTSALQV